MKKQKQEKRVTVNTEMNTISQQTMKDKQLFQLQHMKEQLGVCKTKPSPKMSPTKNKHIKHKTKKTASRMRTKRNYKQKTPQQLEKTKRNLWNRHRQKLLKRERAKNKLCIRENKLMTK